MKDKLSIILVLVIALLIPVTTGKAQILDGLGAANTDTATNTTIMVTQLTTLEEVMRKMKDAADVVKDALKYVKAVEKIKNATELLALIDATVCSMEEYRFYLGFAVKYDCIVNFEFELVNSKFSYATNVIDLAVAADNLLSSGERVTSLKDAIVMLETAMKKTDDFNSSMRETINSNALAHFQSQRKKGMGKIGRY